LGRPRLAAGTLAGFGPAFSLNGDTAMAETPVLKATPRDRVGKGAARAARRQGLVPAVIYGAKEPPLPIALPYKEISARIFGGGFLNTVLSIEVDGETTRVIPRDYQLDPVRDFPVHVDFLRIAEGATVTVEVPVHFVNQEASPGIKRGGVLNIVRHTVELVCPADQIPDHLTADLTGLEINDSLHISAIPLPAHARPTIADRDFTVATVAAPAGLHEDLAPKAPGEGEEGTPAS
jgi:large subunit ribosomal protein L25